jgi:hypothetical protein
LSRRVCRISIGLSFWVLLLFIAPYKMDSLLSIPSQFCPKYCDIIRFSRGMVKKNYICIENNPEGRVSEKYGVE